jgi:hypothetical protein
MFHIYILFIFFLFVCFRENTKEMDGLRPGWAVKAIVVIILTSILFRCVSATNHTVGGSAGWDLASDLRAWSAATTFHVGDSLGSFPFTLLLNSLLKAPLARFRLVCQKINFRIT